MSAQLYDIRPFQSVKKYGQQAGVNAAAVMAELRYLQEHGDQGNKVVGEFRERCFRIRSGYMPPDGAA